MNSCGDLSCRSTRSDTHEARRGVLKDPKSARDFRRAHQGRHTSLSVSLRSSISMYIAIGALTGLCACDPPPAKSLEGREWTEFGIYFVPEDASVSNGGVEEGGAESGSTAGIAGDIAGDIVMIGGQIGEVSGEAVAGVTAGDQAGAISGDAAGGDAGEEGGALAGEMSGDEIVEDPLVAFAEAVIPERDHVALLERGERVVLLWSRGPQIWVSDSMSDGSLAAPVLIYEHSSPIAQLFAETLERSDLILFTDQESASYSFAMRETSAEVIDEQLQILPLKGPLRVSNQDGRALLVGLATERLLEAQGASVTPELNQVAWLSLSEHDLYSESSSEALAQSAQLAPLSWPLPDELGWVSGQPVLRFHQAGQCAYLTPTLRVSGTTPCIPGAGYLLSSSSESVLVHLDQSGTLQATVAASPNLESSYLVAQLTLDVEPDLNPEDQVISMPTFGPFRSTARQVSFIGRRASEESDGLLRDRLLILDPLGLWVSEMGWSPWPHEGLRAVTRRGRQGWGYVFDETHAPRRIVVPLQVNTFNERTPFGLNVNLSCRASVERCDGIDNNCDGVIDNGLCCATGRAPFEAYFIPSAPPRAFFVTDVELADSSRYAIRVADDRWEIWAVYYGSSTRNLYSLGVIEGAHDAIGFTAAGDYAVLVAQDGEGTWRAFWSHINAEADVKDPEDLGCERALSVGNVGYQPTNTSAVVLCDDRVVHLRADRDEDDELIPSETYLEPLSSLPTLEWGKLIRHSSRGEASFSLAFQSLAGQTWEVSKVSIAKSTGGRLNLSLPQGLNGRLGLDGSQRPSPIYLHRDDSPGVPGQLPYLQISDDQRAARVNISVSGQRSWLPMSFGRIVERIEYSEMPSKVVASARHDDGLGVDFYVADFKEYSELNLWVTRPTFVWRTPRLDDALLPEGETPLLWSLIHGNYYNYIGTMFEAGERNDRGDPLPRGVWAVRLYSVTECPR